MKTPDFAIAQNDKTKCTMVWAKDHWTELPEDDYEIIAVIAKLLRTSPDPNKIMGEIIDFNDWGDSGPP